MSQGATRSKYVLRFPLAFTVIGLYLAPTPEVYTAGARKEIEATRERMRMSNNYSPSLTSAGFTAHLHPHATVTSQDGTAGVDNLYGATVGGDGAIVLTGRTQGDWDDLNAGDFDFMAVKFASDGTEKWRFQVSAVEVDGGWSKKRERG